MLTIGMIGGTSWESTAVYYRLINSDVKRRLGGFHSARMVIVSVDFAELEQFMPLGQWDEIGARLADAARAVEAGGADILMLSANTMHQCAEAVQAAVWLPFIHIADVTADAIDAAGHKRVGLLGTRYVMEREFLRQRLESRGLEVLVPEEPDRTTIHDIIFKELVLGEIRGDSRAAFLGVIERLREGGAEGVVLACTEFGLLVADGDASVPLFDTTILHARRAVDMAIGGTER